MAATASDILDRLVTDLQGIDGTGSYTYDLSGGAGVVRLGRPTQDPGRLSVCIYGVEIETTPEASLTEWRRTLRCVIEGHTGATTLDYGARLKASLNLCNDIMRAIEADRQINSNVLDSKLAAAVVDGEDELGGDVTCAFECYWHVTTGV